MSSCGSNTYGIHRESHDRVHIEYAVNGLKCNCVCPACQADLIARNNGKKRAPHFAHASGHACQWAGETDVHLMAKQVIEGRHSLSFPLYRGEAYFVNLGEQNFESVVCEPFINGKRPDCLCVWKDEKGNKIDIWVEIKVTHPVDEQKLTLIKEQGIACIEIDLKQFDGLHELTADFANAVANNANRIWLNAPFLDEIDRQKVEEETIARLKRNDNLRGEVARDIKNKFDNNSSFKIRIPSRNVCLHKDKCTFITKNACWERGDREVDLKEYYDQCELLPSNVDNRVIRLQNNKARYEPLYVAVYGEQENFPDEIKGDKVLALKMISPDVSLQGAQEQYYNFEEKEAKTTISHRVPMWSFILHRSGKWFCAHVSCVHQFNNDNRGIFCRTFYAAGGSYDAHLYCMAMAIDAGHNVRHCSICKHCYHMEYDSFGKCIEYGLITDKWAALSCSYFDRDEELIDGIKKDILLRIKV